MRNEAISCWVQQGLCEVSLWPEKEGNKPHGKWPFGLYGGERSSLQWPVLGGESFLKSIQLSKNVVPLILFFPVLETRQGGEMSCISLKIKEEKLKHM